VIIMSSSSVVTNDAAAAASGSHYAQWAAQTRERAQSMSKTKARAPRNHEVLYGFLLSAFFQEAKGAAPAKQRLALLVGALADADAHPETGRRARAFEVDSKSKSLVEAGVPADKLVKHTHVQAYDTLEASVDDDVYKEAFGADGASVGDVVELHGITFSNWAAKDTGRVQVFCNVDRITLVAGAHCGGYAHDLWLALRRPLERLRLEEAAEGANPDVRLGKVVYALNAFGSDAAAAERYIAGSGAHGGHELALFSTVPEKDPENPKVDTVTYTPDVYNKAAGGFSVENGFQAPAVVDQTFDGSDSSSQVFCKVRQAHIAPLGVTDTVAWPHVGPVLMPQLAFTLLVKQNLEKTANEALAPAAGQFRMHASVQGMLVNVAAQLERIAHVIPADRVVELVGAATDSARAADAYHARPHRGDLVVALSESKEDVAELVRRGRHDFYVLTSMALEPEQADVLEQEPRDKRYLLFDKAFRDAINKAKGQAAKAEVAVRYGLDEASNLPTLTMVAAGAKAQLYYAVLKPEHRLHDVLGKPIFADAAKSLLPDAAGFLAALGVTKKRKAEEDAASVDEAPAAKEARVEEQFVNA
jgi:hypothetical protein